MRRGQWIVALLPAAALSLAAAEGETSRRWEDLPESERVEVMREWKLELEEAQEGFKALQLGPRSGANGSAVLDAVAGLAQLAIAVGDYEDLPRQLDRTIDPDRLEAIRRVVESTPARMMLELLQEYEDLDYAYTPLDLYTDAQRSAEVIQAIRLLPAIAAVAAEEGNFDQSYETLTLLFPIADWLVKERPVILSGILANAAVRSGVRHIEELAQRKPPTAEQGVRLKAVLLRGHAALDPKLVLQGEAAYGRWTLVSDLYDWWEMGGDDAGGEEYWTILQEAGDMAPWRRDASDWPGRIGNAGAVWGPMLTPELISGVDGIFETRFRVEFGLEMLDYYGNRTAPDFPLDPFTGKPMRWREDGEQCTVYSVGRNREDDGGMDRSEHKVTYDVTWRLPCELITPDLIPAPPASSS